MEIKTVTLKRTQQSKAFRNGNQLVFTRAVLKAPANLVTGDLVHVAVQGDVSKKGESKQQLPDVPIGWGVYNTDSLYKIRMLNHKFLQPSLYQAVCNADSQEEAIKILLQHHVQTAVSIRQHALGLPNAATDTYRLIHGEGDGLSGLAVDIIGRNTAVVMSSAAWCERYKRIIEQILKDAMNNNKELCEIVWKTAPARLAQDGYFNANSSTTTNLVVADEEDIDEDDAPKADEPVVDTAEMVVSLENGIYYETYPSAVGQKTGVYSDQRENRLQLAEYCKDKRVLDLCCFTGGFTLNAAIHGGCTHATGVDSSGVAVDTCRANAARNGVENVDFLQAEITAYLQSCKEKYDVVVLDPPKLAPSAKLLDKAGRKYHALNRDAVAVVDEDAGGLLLTCTCSAAMTQAEGGQYFLRMVQAAAQAAGRQVTLLKVNGAAPCHTQSPISYPASAYLTAALFYVHPKR
jgi:23S rRNA (cytosine1962-C5)-methyltransferase